MEETGCFCPTGYHAISTVPKAKQSDRVPRASASEQGQAAAVPRHGLLQPPWESYSGRCQTLPSPSQQLRMVFAQRSTFLHSLVNENSDGRRACPQSSAPRTSCL